MHRSKMIKKNYSLAHYDFMNNLTSWLTITGVLSATVVAIFAICCSVVAMSEIHLWTLPSVIIKDWIALFSKLFVCSRNYPMSHYIEIVGIAIFLMLPIVIVQNCLDLAFDSTMSGFEIISNKVYVFCLTKPLFAMINFIMIWTLFYAHHIIFLFKLLAGTPLFVQVYSVEFIIRMVPILFFWYAAQILYFLVFDMLEYKKSLWQSAKDVLRMIAYQKLLLAQILLIQIVSAVTITAAIYFCLQPAVSVLIKFVFWPFSLFNIVIAPIFIIIMSNFFYCWAYVMLYAWLCLVTAHVYRQLACPPSNNPSCLSCTSCEQ